MPWRIAEATEFLLDLEADGGTHMAPALDYAMKLPARSELLRQIVFITDGSVGNERELLLEIGDKLGDSRLFTVSIGSAPNAWFMRKAAGVGRGIHTHVGRMEDVKARIASLWARIETPAVQNLDVDWGMDAEYYPEVIPDLYAGEPLWLYARLPHVPRDVIVSGELDGRYWETRARPAAGGGGEGIASLWARNRIEALEDSRIFGVDPDEVRQRVTDIALDFGLVTRYTSLVAIDRSPSRAADQGLAQADVPSLLPAGSNFAMGFSQTATGWPAQLALSLLSLFVVLAMLLHTPPKRERHETGSKTSSPKVGA
jgi:Ca-activated chloride channel family protein